MPNPTRLRIRTAALLLALATASACARSTPDPDPDAAPSAASGPRTRVNVITAEEIAGTPASTAYHAIELLRPSYLRALRSSTAPAVYLNGQRWGGLEALRRINASDVALITRLSASEAQMRYGSGLLSSGVIEVETKSSRQP